MGTAWETEVYIRQLDGQHAPQMRIRYWDKRRFEFNSWKRAEAGRRRRRRRKRKRRKKDVESLNTIDEELSKITNILQEIILNLIKNKLEAMMIFLSLGKKEIK